MRPRDIGTRAESAVVRYLQANGWPHCERRALRGSHDAGDITGTPGICWEVKGGAAARAASDGQIERWLDETDKERATAGADHGVLVVQRAGIGPANAGRWWAVLPLCTVGELIEGRMNSSAAVRIHLSTAATLLRAAGYGTEITHG